MTHKITIVALRMLATLCLLSIVCFALARAAPGDPALGLAAEDRAGELLRHLRRQEGLDASLIHQYLSWLRRTVSGNLGTSVSTGESVASLILSKLSVTLRLACETILVSSFAGLAAGIVVVRYRRPFIDRAVQLASLIGFGVPHFLLATVLIWALPALGGSRQSVASPMPSVLTLIWPALVLATTLAAMIMRHLRSSLIDELSRPHITTARAKGLSESAILLRHALRPAAAPLISLAPIICANLLTGCVVTEHAFGIAGLGSLALEATVSRDYDLLQGLTLVVGAIICIIVALSDLALFLIRGSGDRDP